MANNTKTNERKPLFMYLKPAKENRLTEVKERYAGGKLAGLNRVYREKMNDVMKTNLLFSLFAVPILVLIIWGLNYMLSLSDAQYFIGGLGIDYHPGLTSEYQAALLARLDIHLFSFAILIPGFTLLGLGLAGAMNVARKMFYDEEYRILKAFGEGIKKYWWKMMVLMTLIGTLVFVVAVCFIEFYRLQILGGLTGGWYALLFFAMLIGVMLLIMLMQVAPQIVTYDKLKFRHMFYNAMILAIENILWTVLLIVLILASVLLIVYAPMFAMIVYVLLFMFGFMYFIMCNLQIGNYAFDLYINPMYDMLGEDTGISFIGKKAKDEPKQEQNRPKQQKKKSNQNTPYVNPKKKKSQKKK